MTIENERILNITPKERFSNLIGLRRKPLINKSLNPQPINIYSKLGTLSRRGILKKGEVVLYKNPNQIFISVDLNNIDRINNRHSYDEGDRILLGMVSLLNDFAKDRKGAVGQWHNDVFIIIYANEEEHGNLENDIERLLWDIGNLEKVKFEVSAAAGIYYSTGKEEENVDYCINCANVARKDAKRTVKGFKLFDPDVSETINQGKIRIERAILMRELTLNYQPVVNIQTNEIVGAEALIRWNCPSKGIIPPNEFIPEAESNGAIDKIGNFVLQEVCNLQKRIRDDLDTSLPISINVSTKELNRNYTTNLVETLNSYKIKPSGVIIEITESESIELSEIKKIITELHKAGFKVWVDDFGTGFASLSYLKSTPVTGVKIDKSFIDLIDKDPQDLKMLEGIVQLVQSLGFDIVCEGVERESQLSILKGMGLEKVQGFYYYRPAPVAQYLDYITKQTLGKDRLEGNELMEMIEVSISN